MCERYIFLTMSWLEGPPAGLDVLLAAANHIERFPRDPTEPLTFEEIKSVQGLSKEQAAHTLGVTSQTFVSCLRRFGILWQAQRIQVLRYAIETFHGMELLKLKRALKSSDPLLAHWIPTPEQQEAVEKYYDALLHRSLADFAKPIEFPEHVQHFIEDANQWRHRKAIKNKALLVNDHRIPTPIMPSRRQPARYFMSAPATAPTPRRQEGAAASDFEATQP